MPDLDDVRRLASALPEVAESTSYGNVSWKVRGKQFVWERPLRRSDRDALGAGAPEGPIIALRTDGQAGKEALLATGGPACFTIPHFDGYPAVLVRLDLVAPDDLAELVVEAWLAQAPKKLAQQFLDGSAG
jgi:hypothetical protein